MEKKIRQSAVVLSPERGVLHDEAHTRPPVYYEMKKFCRGECFVLCRDQLLVKTLTFIHFLITKLPRQYPLIKRKCTLIQGISN